MREKQGVLTSVHDRKNLFLALKNFTHLIVYIYIIQLNFMIGQNWMLEATTQTYFLIFLFELKLRFPLDRNGALFH